MRHQLLRTFLWAGAIYLALVRFFAGILLDEGFGINELLKDYCRSSPVITWILGDYAEACSFAISIPIYVVLIPQTFVLYWLLDYNGPAADVILLPSFRLGAVFWGSIFSYRQYLKLKNEQLTPIVNNESLVSHSTKSKVFRSFWAGFLSIEVVFHFRQLIASLIAARTYSDFIDRFNSVDCSWLSTINNLLSFTPIHCTARQYFSNYEYSMYRLGGDDSNSSSPPSLIEEYFNLHNTATFVGDSLLWGLIFAGLCFIAIKLWPFLQLSSKKL
jgi:hypothetical protein